MYLYDDEDKPDMLFRIVKTDPPTIKDFQSRQEQGLSPLDPTQPELNSGISALDTEDRALELAAQYRWHRRFVAAFVPQGHWRIERTLPRDGHYTVWADAQELLDSVVAVVPVRAKLVIGMAMQRGYELWDAETGNAVGGYESRTDAIRALSRIARYQSAALSGLVLVQINDVEDNSVIASGTSELMGLIEAR